MLLLQWWGKRQGRKHRERVLYNLYSGAIFKDREGSRDHPLVLEVQSVYWDKNAVEVLLYDGSPLEEVAPDSRVYMPKKTLEEGFSPVTDERTILRYQEEIKKAKEKEE